MREPMWRGTVALAAVGARPGLALPLDCSHAGNSPSGPTNTRIFHMMGQIQSWAMLIFNAAAPRLLQRASTPLESLPFSIANTHNISV